MQPNADDLRFIRETLRAIDSGDLQARLDPADLGLCYRYDVSNGCVIWVFDDAGQWDYIQEFVMPDSRSFSFDDLFAADSWIVMEYCPENPSAWGDVPVDG